SMGPQGAMVISKYEAEVISSPKVTTLSTVGAGDSMVAGIVHAISKGIKLLEAVQFGVACGTATTMVSGSDLFKVEDVYLLFDQIKEK
ncbi:MAG: PfkB family carbohydrate kinase, partial [Bacteroidota bacterium]|nr:PfkB family carbohydrate kinase [Bacteroidota bacterium]